MKRKLTRTIARICFFGGLALALTGTLLVVQRHWPNQFPELAEAAQLVQADMKATAAYGTWPIYVRMPRLGIELPIIPAVRIDGTWQVSPKNISAIAPHSPELGWILYGHNWPRLLGPLHQALVGDELVLYFADDAEKTYHVVGISTVNPSQDTVLHQVPSDHLLLYTCTGFFDKDRLIVILKESAPVNADHP